MSGRDSGVAVVIVCFELGRTLPDAVESALRQTVPAREIVVVDDGSRDALTRQVLAWYENAEHRVRVMRLEHQGVARARNAGVAATTAPLVVLLDADDLLEPTYLERASRLLHDRPDLSYVCCALEAFGDAAYRWKPPPYTIADAIGRGACGHISTVFRRELWHAIGGFDEALPAYEDVDFWLRALTGELRGAILDDALLRYRVRVGSRYHGAVTGDGYVRAKQKLLDKHEATVVDRGEDVLVAITDFQREQRGHRQALLAQRDDIRAAREVVEEEIVEVRARLDRAGIAPLAWGDFAGTGSMASVEGSLRDRALGDLVHGARRRSLLVEDTASLPDADDRRWDRILVDGALNFAVDPAAALRACRDALRAGGELIVVAGVLALGDRARGITEASLRTLLCDLFAPSEVTVRTYGNLVTTLAAAAHASRELVDPRHLVEDDPSHPTLVAAFARVPTRLGRRGAGHPPARPGSVRRFPARHGMVLAYHRISDLEPDTHGLCTAPALFREHMELLSTRFEVLPLAALVARAVAGELSADAVAVTFDDGYHDNLAVASPILRELGLPATFFVGGAPPEQPREAWWDVLEYALLAVERLPERLTLTLGELHVDLPTATSADRRATLRALHGHLLEADQEGIDAILASVAEWSGRDVPVRQTHRLLTAAEVVELDFLPGHDVQAHGLHHLMLPAHPPDVRAEELTRSRLALERLLARPVTALSYPYGACDLTTADIAEQAGFEMAFTAEPDPITRDSDPLRLPRMEVGQESVSRLHGLLERGLALAA